MNQDLLDRVLQSPRLPSLPAIAVEVISLVQQQDVNIKQIAHTIQHDPALASKILKTVNSSFYGQVHAISTISHALVVLGLNSVKTLALGFSLVANLKASGGEGFDHLLFWKRSLYTATAAKSLARQMGLVQQEEAFLGGLCQDLGMLVMNQVLGPTYTAILDRVGADHHRLRSFEIEAFRIDHTHVGAALAQRWNLPPLLIEPIRCHEDPEQAEEELAPLVRSVAVGNRAADVFISTTPSEALAAYLHDAERWCGLDRAVAEPLLRSIHRETREMRRLFDLPVGELGNPDELLARANETLLEISLQTQQHSSALEEENRQLVQQVATDSLTGVATRRKFSEVIALQFERVAKAGGQAGPLSLLFVDVDHFKQFNDTHGHPTGDRVLVEIASLLQRIMPEVSLVARYGGEEFVVVLPGIDRRTAAMLAEKVRKALQAISITSDEGELLKLTASIGVATYEGALFERVEQLIKAADQAVYAAKHAGRNCVRVFTPRPVPVAV